MRGLLLAAIRAYQRYVSPHKGYCCAYRVHTGRASCSTLGYRAVRRHGVVLGLALIRRRTWLCGVAHRRHAQAALPLAPARHQRGFCDVGCDPGCAPGCDAGALLPSDLHCLGDLCGSSCNPGGCDGSRSSRRASQKEKYVYIPPQARRPGPAGGRHAPVRPAPGQQDARA